MSIVGVRVVMFNINLGEKGEVKVLVQYPISILVS